MSGKAIELVNSISATMRGRENCDCDGLGEWYYCVEGKWVKKSKHFRAWMDEAQVSLHAKNTGLEITGRSVSCSKCGRIAISNFIK